MAITVAISNFVGKFKPVRYLARVVACVLSITSLSAIAYDSIAISEYNQSIVGVSASSSKKYADSNALDACKIQGTAYMQGQKSPDFKCHVVERFHKGWACVAVDVKRTVSGYSISQTGDGTGAEAFKRLQARAKDKCTAVIGSSDNYCDFIGLPGRCYEDFADPPEQ